MPQPLTAFYENQDMENISRRPNFKDFVTILTEGSMQDNTVARQYRLQVQTTDSPPPLSSKCT
jgi:hypothetical protein